ncbi:MAG: hypothetical protein D6706_02050, partial [Chloroflexi bacterium]
MTSASTSSSTTNLTKLPRVMHPEVATLAQRPFPPLHHYIHHGQPATTDELIVLVSPEALRQIDNHSQQDLTQELGGGLLGTAYRHNGQVFVHITAALPVNSPDHGPIHFTFTADAWRQLQQERDAQYPALEIVGWFHTHPDLGVFYSSDDVVVHSAAFTLPWHVGLVVDPVRQEACFFGWVNGELKALGGFYETAEFAHDTAPESAVSWRTITTTVHQPSPPPAHP